MKHSVVASDSEGLQVIVEVKNTYKEIWKKIKKDKVSYAFIAPYFILFCLFTAVPVITSMILSLTYFNILEPPKFIGFANYLKLFLYDDVFLIAVKNTFILAAVTGPVSYILSFIFAWIINELKPKFRAIVTLMFYAPSISGNIYLIWAVLFNGDSYGYINGLLLKLGVVYSPIQWFTDTKYMMKLLIAVVLWTSIGTSFLAFIAGLQGIDKTQYESGAIDGIKNRWQELWFITLPNMKPQLMFGAVMSITSSFGIGDVVTNLCGFPSTNYAVHTIINHLQDYGGIRFEMGYASAIATILFLVMILSNFIIKRLLSKVGE